MGDERWNLPADRYGMGDGRWEMGDGTCLPIGMGWEMGLRTEQSELTSYNSQLKKTSPSDVSGRKRY
jgi:hypothetical protein